MKIWQGQVQYMLKYATSVGCVGGQTWGVAVRVRQRYSAEQATHSAHTVRPHSRCQITCNAELTIVCGVFLGAP